jgi:hypothetical protein
VFLLELSGMVRDACIINEQIRVLEESDEVLGETTINSNKND